MPLFRPRARRATGAFEPCLPRPAKAPPTRPDWIHEIKHDGFRLIAHRSGDKVRLISRQRRDLTYRFPVIIRALAALLVTSCTIDGEAIVCDENGVAVFTRRPPGRRWTTEPATPEVRLSCASRLTKR
jgi:ATP-dependent DNA ligase